MVTRYVRIAPGQRELNLQLDVEPPAFVQQMYAHEPAPELRGIKGWKNTKPLRLTDLRGKLVLLEFWGHWCGRCVAGMPELMKLYDEFYDRGLEVIAIHDDSADSIEDMDRKLARARDKIEELLRAGKQP